MKYHSHHLFHLAIYYYMFSKKHKKVLLITGSVASGKSYFCTKLIEKNSYIDLDKVVNLYTKKIKTLRKKVHEY